MAKKSPFLSIIVPCHNSQNTIFKALKSIQDQSFRNWECLVIENGSSDNTIEIVKRFLESDDRFKLYSLSVKGLANARNFGLTQVTGKYISFVDSDDFIHREFLFRLVSSSFLNNADISFCDVVEIRRGQFIRLNNFHNKTLLINEAVLACELAKDYRFKSYLCNKIFRVELFRGFKFNGEILEDFEFFNFLLGKNLKAVYTPFSGYFYTFQSSSVSRTINCATRLARLPPVKRRLEIILSKYPEYAQNALKNLVTFVDLFITEIKKDPDNFALLRSKEFLDCMDFLYPHLNQLKMRKRRRFLFFLIRHRLFEIVNFYFYRVKRRSLFN